MKKDNGNEIKRPQIERMIQMVKDREKEIMAKLELCRTCYNCGRCVHYDKPINAGTKGRCTRYPPEVLCFADVGGPFHTRWPEVSEDNRCGEFICGTAFVVSKGLK